MQQTQMQIMTEGSFVIAKSVIVVPKKKRSKKKRLVNSCKKISLEKSLWKTVSLIFKTTDSKKEIRNVDGKKCYHNNNTVMLIKLKANIGKPVNCKSLKF